jgi:hypothetical protein
MTNSIVLETMSRALSVNKKTLFDHVSRKCQLGRAKEKVA